jgi:hypothetical protein
MEADLGAGPVWKLSARVPDAHWPLILGIHRTVENLGVELGDNKTGGGSDLGPLRRQGVPTLAPALDATHYFDIHHTPNDTLEQVDPRSSNNRSPCSQCRCISLRWPHGPVERIATEPNARN